MWTMDAMDALAACLLIDVPMQAALRACAPWAQRCWLEARLALGRQREGRDGCASRRGTISALLPGWGRGRSKPRQPAIYI